MFKSLQQLFSHVNQKSVEPIIGLDLAMAVLLYEVAAADSTITPDEESQMEKLLAESFELSTSQAVTLLADAKTHQHNAVSLQQFTHILRENLDRQQRVNFLNALWQVAHSDQEIDINEEHIIRKVSDLLYLNHSDYIQAKLKVLSL